MTSADDLVEFEGGGLSWTSEADVADAVREHIATSLDALESIPGAEVLKRNLVRAVFRVPLPGFGRVIVKRYAVGGPVDWTKYSFKPSRAVAEWRTGRALHAAGIATAVPFAMGERRDVVLRDAALVTREITDTVHLNAYVERDLVGDAESDRLREQLFARLARMIRLLHDSGFVHNDLHGGNVLVNGPPEDAQPHIIDLHSVQRTAAPRPGARWFDLVKLLHSIRTCSTPDERLELCREYESCGDGPSGTEATHLLASDALLDHLEPRIMRMERKRVRSRTQRSLTRSSRFDITRVGPFSINHLREHPAASFVPLVEAHLATVAAGGATVLKDARRSALTRQTWTAADGERSVVVKQYRSERIGDRLKNLLRTPRSVRAWVAGHGLYVRGFECALPLALLRGGRLGDAYIIMEDLGDETRADLVALARFAGNLDTAARAAKRRLIEAAASLFRRLHAEHVYHADLKAVNLFVRDQDGRVSIVLADYDRVEFDAEVPRRRRLKNLSQLSASVAICITTSDRLRFFREYARDDAVALRDWKQWFREVVALCRPKIVVRMNPIE